mgnify:CR=1 FL=1
MSYSSSDKYKKSRSTGFRMNYSSPSQDREEKNDAILNPQKSIDRRNLLDYTDISDVIGSQEYKDYSRKLQSRVNDMGYTSYQDIPENIFNSLHKQGHSQGYPTPKWMTKHDFVYDDIIRDTGIEKDIPLSKKNNYLKAYYSIDPYSTRERRMGNPFPWFFASSEDEESAGSTKTMQKMNSIMDMLNFY